MKKRLDRVVDTLQKIELDGLCVTNTQDLFYLLDLELSRGFLLVTCKRATLFVDGRYFEACSKKAKEANEFDVVLLSDESLKEYIEKVQRLGFDQSHETYESYLFLKTLGAQELVPLVKPMQKLRATKDAGELKKIEEACLLCCEGFHYVVSLLKEGVSEKMLAKQLEIFWLQKGADRLGFNPIIAFGVNSALPHHRAGETTLKRNTLVLVDIGVVLDGYHSDMTRMVYFGTVDPQLEKICSIVEEAQKTAIQAVKAGVMTDDLDLVAREVIGKAGYGQYFVHGLGHGVGLEIHEEPRVKNDPHITNTKLEEGMVITIEPGIYLPALGGSRIEDTLVVEKTGSRSLIPLARSPLQVENR